MHQRFRFMGVELIGDKDPGGLWIGLDSLSNMSSKVGFRARRSNAGRDDLSGSYVQIGDQTMGTMTAIFEFLAFDMTGQHR